MECCHYDGDPANNRVGNLRWDTRSSNNLDAVRHGTHWAAKKTHCKHGHEFTPENTGVQAGGRGRRCRTCVRQNREARAQRAKDDPIVLERIRKYKREWARAKAQRREPRQ
jgi:hypothetical protein